jgi:hypothetical protein
MHALNLASCKGVTCKYILGAKMHSMMLQLPSILNLRLEHHHTHHRGHSTPYQGVCMLRIFCKNIFWKTLFSILEWRMGRPRWIDCNVFIPRISCCGFFCLSVKATHTFDLFFVISRSSKFDAVPFSYFSSLYPINFCRWSMFYAFTTKKKRRIKSRFVLMLSPSKFSELSDCMS